MDLELAKELSRNLLAQHWNRPDFVYGHAL